MTMAHGAWGFGRGSHQGRDRRRQVGRLRCARRRLPGPQPAARGKGRLGATRQQFLELVVAFPDLKMMVQDQIAEGDRVVNRVLVRGTHQGEYMGMPGSGKTIEIGGIDILRMVNDKVAERWGYFDDLKLMQQLGAMPGSKE